MKKIKYIISILVFLLLLLFNGEFYQKHLDSFTEKFWYIDREYWEGEDWEELISDVESLCSEYHIKFFTIFRQIDVHNNWTMLIYSNNEMKQELIQDYEIEQGIHSSVFSGQTTVKFESFEAASNNKNIYRYYFEGKKENLLNVYTELNDKYGTSYIRQENNGGLEWILTLLWLVFLIFIVLLTVFDMSFQRREAFIRLSMGSSKWKIVIDNIIKDTLFYGIVFFSLIFILKQYTYVFFKMYQTLIFLSVFLIVNSLLYLSMLRYNLKKALSKNNISESLLGNCYILKVITLILVLISISSNILLIYKNGSFINQYRIIEEFKDYTFLDFRNYAGVPLMGFESYDELIKKVFREKYNTYETAYSVCQYDDESKYKYLLVNEKAKTVLHEIKEIEEIDNTKNIHILIPADAEEQSHILETAQQQAMDIGSALKDNSYEVIKYQKDCSVLYYDSTLSMNSDFAENPVIIYYTFTEDEMVNELGHIMGIGKNIMYRLTEEEILKLEEELNLSSKGIYISAVNVADSYIQYKNIVEKGILLNTVISIFMFLINITIISVIIFLEYQVHATELAIKKILGYTIAQKNSGILKTVFYTAIVGITAVVILSVMYKFSSWYLVLGSGILLTLTELMISMYFIIRMEKSSISKILKGGSL